MRSSSSRCRSMTSGSCSSIAIDAQKFIELGMSARLSRRLARRSRAICGLHNRELLRVRTLIMTAATKQGLR